MLVKRDDGLAGCIDTEYLRLSTRGLVHLDSVVVCDAIDLIVPCRQCQSDIFLPSGDSMSESWLVRISVMCIIIKLYTHDNLP